MGKDKATKIGRKRKKGQMIVIGVIAAIAVGIGFGIYNYTQHPPRATGFGALGSAHEHAAFRLFINNEEPVNFAQSQYQIKSSYIHIEDNNGVLIHRHATGVDLGFLFESFKMKFDSQCVTLGNGTSYCDEGDKTLKFFVNGVRNDMYGKYVLKDGDKILISYGKETQEQIEGQLRTLDLISIPPKQ